MVGTVSAAREEGRKAGALAAGAFTAGLAVTAALVFGGLGLLGAAVQSRALTVAAIVVAGAAIVSDALGARVRPQVRLQVPEHWRRTLPLPLALFLYGLLLGAGMTTYVPVSTAWALVPLSLALGSPTASLALGFGFAAGRALPIVVLAARGGETVVAERPRGLRVLRVLAAGSLLVALVAGEARAATTVASPGGEPSAAGTDLAWQQPGVGGFLDRDGVRAQLPGSDPAIGDGKIAWRSGDAVTVAARDTLAPALHETVRGVQKLAVSDRWLAWRARREIRVQPLTDPSRSIRVAKARRAAELGRPSLSGDLLVYHLATPAGSSLTAVDVATGTRRLLRFARRAQLLNPSVLGESLLYVRTSRCSQQLRLARLGAGPERVLYRLPPLAGQDRGHERHHTSRGQQPPCPGRPKPTRRILWTTALSDTTAYVTILRPGRNGRATPTLLAIPRP